MTNSRKIYKPSADWYVMRLLPITGQNSRVVFPYGGSLTEVKNWIKLSEKNKHLDTWVPSEYVDDYLNSN